jgi:Secretion system C-terminal sorting domain/GEVED domain
MKKITLLIAFLLSSIYGFSQASGYSFSESAGTYTPVVGTVSTATGDDTIQNSIPIGFTFKFEGVDYTHFCVSPNGWIKLGNATTIGSTGAANYTNNLSNTATNRPLLAVLWDDNHKNTGDIQFLLSGTAPNQTLEVGWNAVNIGGGGATSATELASYKIKLYQTTNVIEFVYGSTLGTAGALTASVGLNGTSSFLSVTPGAPSSTSSTTADDAISETVGLVDKKLTFTPPSCLAPVGITASVIATSSATVSWNAVVPTPATGYQYVVSTDANAPAGAGTATTAVSVPVTLLTANTLYYIYVRTACGGSFSAWSSLSFTTPCVAVTSFNENFDGVTEPALPNCWSGVFDGAAPGAQVITGTTFSSAPNALRMRSDASAPTASVIAVSPNISNLSAGTHRLVFKAITNNNADDLIIGTLSNPNDATTFTPLQNIDLNTTYAQYFVSFSGYTGTNQYIGFKRLCVNQFNSVFVDDIAWETIPAVAPVCATSIVATPDAACGNFNTPITWVAAPNADGYKLTVGTTAGGSNILNNVSIGNVLNYSLPGNFATTYFYKIVPFNAVGDAVGCTEQSFTTFATGCYCPSVPTSNDGNGISNVQLGTTDFPTTDVTYFDHTATAVALPQSVNANVQITFETGYTYNTHTWIDFNNNLTFEASELVKSIVATVATNPNTMDASFIMPLTAPLGVHRMRIVSTDAVISPANACYSGTYGVTLDFNVNITAAPSCLTPVGLTSSAITANTATISWTAVSPAPSVGYEYVYSTTNVAPVAAGTPATAITANLTMLMSNTQYYLFVRSNCGSGFSTWSPSSTFTTLCAPEAAPAAQNFDTFLPSACWTLGQGGTLATGPTAFDNADTGGWTADGFANITALGAIDVNVYQNAVLNDWIISPTYTIPASGYNLKFDAAATQYLGFGTPVAPTTPWEADDKVEILVSTTGTTNWTVLNTFNDTNQPSFTGDSFTYSLNGYAGQNVRIAFRGLEGTADGSADIEFSIDNLAITNLLKTESFDLTGFSAYPNPVKDILNLSYTKEISNVSIHNLLGQEVMTKSINASQSKIDMSNLTNGTYLVKVTVDGLVKTLKVVKQ